MYRQFPIHTVEEITAIKQAIESHDLLPADTQLGVITISLPEGGQSAALEVLGTSEAFDRFFNSLKNLSAGHPVRPMVVDNFRVAMDPNDDALNPTHLHNGRYAVFLTNPTSRGTNSPQLAS